MKSIGNCRTIISSAVATWFLQNSQPIGGPGVVVEIDKAKFGKMKFITKDTSHILEEYLLIKQSVQFGKTLLDACKLNGVCRTQIYQRRYIAELMETDTLVFEELKQKVDDEKLKLITFGQLCKDCMMSSPLKNKATEMIAAGALLP